MLLVNINCQSSLLQLLLSCLIGSLLLQIPNLIWCRTHLHYQWISSLRTCATLSTKPINNDIFECGGNQNLTPLMHSNCQVPRLLVLERHIFKAQAFIFICILDWNCDNPAQVQINGLNYLFKIVNPNWRFIVAP